MHNYDYYGNSEFNIHNSQSKFTTMITSIG